MADFYGTATVGSASGGSVSVWVRAYASLSPSATVAAASTITIDGDTETVNHSSITVGSNTLVGSHQISVALGTSPRSVPWSTYTNLTPGGAGSDSGTVTVPARPPQLPSAATSASATYVSDSQTTVAWTRPANAGDYDYIWSQTEIQRWAASTGTWGRVALLNGSPTSWADITTSPNDRYQYRVRGVNVTGGGEWETTGYVYTTPAAPTGVTATKVGSDIYVSWTDQSRAETGFEVQDETTTVGTPTASPFRHESPSGARSHRYRVRATTPDTNSDWSAYSNAVSLIGPPAAPSDLYPNGHVIPSGTVTLSWRHNPVDGSAQTAFEAQHREVGAGSWTTVSGTTADEVEVTAYTGEADVEWQVRTKGDHVDWSPWSALANFPVTAVPTATITAPGATIDVPYVTAEWAFGHTGGSTQSGWEAQVVRDSMVIASGSGAGTTDEWTSADVLNEGDEVTTRVRVRETAGLWSEWDEVTSDVSFPQPAPSIVSAAWIDGEGYVLITATAGSEDGAPATVSQSVERSTDGGTTWVVLASGLGADAALTDWEAPAAGTYHYRVSAYAESDAVHRTTVPVTVPATPVNDLVWVGGGPGFAQAVKLAWNPTLGYEGGRERALNVYDARPLPVETSTVRTPKTLSVSTTVVSDTEGTRAHLEDLFDLPGPHLYRDALGRVLYGSLSDLRWSREPGAGRGGVSFTVTQSDRGTDTQLVAVADAVEIT